MENEEKQTPIAEKKTDKSTDLIDRANAAALRLEDANRKQEELLKKQEAMQIERTLNGKADAGTEEKEETPEEYTKRILEGQGNEN